MALGKQFENTYWYTDDGDVHTSLVNLGGRSQIEFGPMPEDSLDSHLDIARGATEDKEGTARIENVQGMLFDPYHGTGLVHDALTSKESRAGAARRALKLDDSIATAPGRTPAVIKHQDAAVDSLVGSHMPKWEMDKVAEQGNARTHVKTTPGRSFYDYSTGSAYSSGGRINLHPQHIPNWDESGNYKPISAFSNRVTVHEMGHAKDRSRLIEDRNVDPTRVSTQQGGRWRRYASDDPLAEGIADGYADTYGGEAPNRLQSAINNPEFAETDYQSTGYSTKHTGFKTNAHRAIYAAMRAHVGMGGDIDEVTSRVQVEDMPEMSMTDRFIDAVSTSTSKNHSVTISNVLHEATLGHIWETMPHVRGHLTRLGFHRDAMKAAAENKLHRDEWTRKNVGEQLDLGI